MIALNAVKSELFGEGGGAEVESSELLDGLQELARRRPRASRSGTTCASARTRRRPSRSPATSPTRRSRRPAAATGSSTTARSSRCPTPGRPRPAAQRDWARHASNVLMVAGKRSAVGPSAVRRRPADRLLLSRPDARDGPPRARLERPRRDLGAVPRLHPDRPARGLRLDAHLGGRGHRRQLRRDALRRQRHEVPLQGQVPLDDARSTPADLGPAGDLQPHRPRAGDRLRDGRRHARRDRPQALQLPHDGVDLLLFQRSPAARSANARDFIKAAAISPQTFNTFYADSDEAAQITTGRLPLRPRAWTRACPPTVAATTSGRAGCRAKDHPHGISAAAC